MRAPDDGKARAAGALLAEQRRAWDVDLQRCRAPHFYHGPRASRLPPRPAQPKHPPHALGNIGACVFFPGATARTMANHSFPHLLCHARGAASWDAARLTWRALPARCPLAGWPARRCPTACPRPGAPAVAAHAVRHMGLVRTVAAMCCPAGGRYMVQKLLLLGGYPARLPRLAALSKSHSLQEFQGF